MKTKKKEESGSEDENEDKNTSSDDEDTKKKQKNGKLVGKKRSKKDDSSDDDSESEDDKEKKKNGKAKKRARTSSVSSGPITRKKSEEMGDYVPPVRDPNAVGIPAPGYKFQRINEDKYRNLLNETAADNSFESKARFGLGGGDKFGEWSNSKLFDKVGKGFKKEKGKMKNRNFHAQGQGIDSGINSVKL